MPSAKCDTCHKEYQIKQVDKKYRCKECEGTIRAVTLGVICPRCKTSHHKQGVRFCGECGHPLEAGAEPGLSADKVERDFSTKKIRGALALMGYVRVFFILGAIVYGGFFILAMQTAFQVQNRMAGFLAMIIAGITGAICSLMIIGAWKIYVYPFVLSLILACFSSVELVMILGDINILLITKFVIALLCWAAVVAAANMRKQLKKFPQMYVSTRGKLCTHRDTEGKINKRLAQKAKVSQRKRNLILMYAGISAAGFVLIFAAILQLSQPGPILETVDHFIQEWNTKRDTDSTAAELSLFFEEQHQKRMFQRLRKRFKKFNWDKQCPSLVKEAEINEIGQGRCAVSFSFKDPDIYEPMDTTWEYKDGGWRLRTIRYPRNL